MLSEWFSCKGACSGSDRVSDTVKVDVAALSTQDKENMKPVPAIQKKDETQKRREEVYKQAQEEVRQKEAEQRRLAEECQRAEEAKRRQQEEEAKALEALERKREAAEREAAERAAAEAAAAAAEAEKREREEADRVAREKARQAREAVEKAAALRAQQMEQEREAREKVDAWCKELGFADLNSKKSSFRGGTKYPLHKAVSTQNEEMVRLLVHFGSERNTKSSKGHTPVELARRMNTDGSMDNIVAILA